MVDKREKKTPKRDQAIALQYRSIEELPKVIASGSGEIAKKIVALAAQHGIPLKEDATLSEMLAQLPTGSEISHESFKLVAEIISFLYHTDTKFREAHPELAQVMTKAAQNKE